ncbi:MAG: GAF domain-containing protein [Pseudomonadota bacterium]
MTRMLQALAQPDQPVATYRALEAEAQSHIGIRLFTLMTLDHETGLARRCYSNVPEAYPPSGAKEITPNAWTKTVLDRQEVFVANTLDEIAAVFPDHELIQSLGCESCLNIPILVGGEVIGTLNCLHEAGHYTAERVAKAHQLKEPGALALLLALINRDEQ